jgi:hypothetical protein
VNRTPVIEPRSENGTPSPAVPRQECTNYVDLARRMSIPADDAIRQFIESWVTRLRPAPNAPTK